MGIITSIKKSILLGLKKAGITGNEYHLLFSDASIPSVNNTLNKILSFNPRVTHPSEFISLGLLASTCKKNIVEIGCYLGYASCVMASAIGSDRKVIAIDMFDRKRGWKNKTSDDWIFKTYDQIDWAKKVARDLGLGEKIIFIESSSGSYFDQLSKDHTNLNFDLLFIDGDHSFEGCLEDFEHYCPLLEAGGYVVAHDYNSMHHPGVKQAADLYLSKNKNFTPKYVVQSMLIIQKVDNIIVSKK